MAYTVISLKEVTHGANAIESDLSFDSKGNLKEFYAEGYFCNFFTRGCNQKYYVLNYFAIIRQNVQNKTQKLALFWIDLKLTESGMTDFFSSGQKLAESMTRRGSLFPPDEEVPVDVLLGVEHVSQKDFFRGFREVIKNHRPELLPKFGYDISAGEDVDTILDALKSIGIKENIWLGVDVTSASPKMLTNYPKELVKKRDLEAEV